MKTALALIVAATTVLIFAETADAHWGRRYTAAYYAPTAAYYPTSAYYVPTTAYYGGGGYYGGGYGSGYYGGGYYGGGYGSGYYGGGYYGGYRGGLFGTGVGGWAGVRGVNRRWDRRGW